MCAYPIDGATDNRSESGCGAHTAYPTESVPCQQQGIFTADEWYSHYQEGNSSHFYQCGFITSSTSSYDIADAFYQSILSMAKFSESFTTPNEVVLKTWNYNSQDSLPIQAFFYLDGSEVGKSNAQNDQQMFYKNTTKHIWIPVIKIVLPTNISEDAAFSYSPSDQLVPEVVPQKLPLSTKLNVNGATFESSSGFPKTAFKGAKFQILMDGSAENNNQYIWSTMDSRRNVDSTTSSVSVDENGMVTYISDGAKDDVYVYATSKNGAESKVFTINLEYWFINDNDSLMNRIDADKWCTSQTGGYSLAPQILLSNSVILTSPGYRLGTSGQLWPEWGGGAHYGNGWQSDWSYFASEHYGVYPIIVSLGSSGYKSIPQYPDDSYYVACMKTL